FIRGAAIEPATLAGGKELIGQPTHCSLSPGQVRAERVGGRDRGVCDPSPISRRVEVEKRSVGVTAWQGCSGRRYGCGERRLKAYYGLSRQSGQARRSPRSGGGAGDARAAARRWVRA